MEWRNYLLALVACAAVVAGTALIALPLKGLSQPLTFGLDRGPGAEQERQIEQTCVDSAVYQGFKPGPPGFDHDVLRCENSARAAALGGD